MLSLKAIVPLLYSIHQVKYSVQIMESTVGKKISYLAETYQLLPETQVKARRGKSTETALELLTEQVHTVWGQGNNKVAALLSVDIAGAFETVSHQRLIYNSRARKYRNGLLIG